MQSVRSSLRAAAGLAAALFTTLAGAQAWPSKPITLVVPFAAGGPTAVVARLLGGAMTKSLNQTVVIKTGAGGTIAAGAVARAAPDGHRAVRRPSAKP